MRFFPILAAALASLPVSAPGQQSLMSRAYDSEGKLRIEMTSVFDGAMTQGFMPVRVTLRNGQERARDWSLSFDFGGGWNNLQYGSAFSLSAAPGGETVHEILVPVPTMVGPGSNYRSLTVRAASPGLAVERSANSSQCSPGWAGIGLSAAIANRNANSLNQELNAGGAHIADRFGYAFDPAMLPADWRGYSGLDVLMITEAEWRSLAAGPRRAILEWVRLGGRLDFYVTGDTAGFLKSVSIGRLTPEGNVHRVEHGLGHIEAYRWDGNILDPASVVKRYQAVKNQSQELSQGYLKWELQAAFGKKSFNPLLVILLLIVFGIVIGPVNLFVFAKPGKRHRLFVTVPLIALVTSSLIVVLILFSDGVGGSGRRLAIVQLEGGPEERRLYAIQEQISRAGVLLGSAFEVAETVFLSPVLLPPSEWNRLRTSVNTIARYSFSGGVYRGDWFQSRSEQGHFLQSVHPTRSRIELREPSLEGKKPPRLVSSLDFAVDGFFYRDEQGNCWKAENELVAGGDEIELTAVTSAELTGWWKNETLPVSERLAGDLQRIGQGRGRFFAVSSDRKAGFVETLDAIDWKQDRALIFGPVIAAETDSPWKEKAKE